MRNFAILGVAGYIAPRHLEAIQAGGHRLVAAMDPSDSVGLLDRYSFEVEYFRELSAFVEMLRRRAAGPAAERVHYVAVCTPNDLHAEHLELALRAGADAICEKPLLLSARGLDALAELERVTGRRVYTVLQLRLHPALLALKHQIETATSARKAEVELTYVTSRGPWYDVSWKGSAARSGGAELNIGVHLFDLLLWLFGQVEHSEVHAREERFAAGALELRGARVRWFLSIDRRHLPPDATAARATTHRSIRVDGVEIEFSSGFADLHQAVYRATLAGRGCGIAEARPSLELVDAIREAAIVPAPTERELSEMTPPTYFVHESSYVDADVTIGEGTRIWHFSHILTGSRIGRGCNLGQNVVVGPNVRLGDNVKVQNNVSLYDGVELEDDVFCGPSMVFTNVVNPRSHVPRRHEYRPTLVRRGATLGANCTVLCGITIGAYAFVGAGAVVTRSVADHALVTGNPARHRGWMCACGVKLEFVGVAATCAACAATYALRDGACVAERRAS